MIRTMRMLRRFFSDCSGLIAAEYALMLGVFCLGCLCAALEYSHQLSLALDRASSLISSSAAGEVRCPDAPDCSAAANLRP